MKIRMTDVRMRYLSIAEARRQTGLRLVLGAYAVPGPWREACKAIFHVKGVPYQPVVTANEGCSDADFGMNGSASELLDWTGQESAPVAAWNDERPCSSWVEQLYLAERIAPLPPLIPEDVGDRVAMFGMAHELCGRGGLAWCKRLEMIHANLSSMTAEHPARTYWIHMAQKYGYTSSAAEEAPGRIANILRALGLHLERQYAVGSNFFVGSSLSALDLYWATFLGILRPLDEALCPMATPIRRAYETVSPEVEQAISPLMLRHRDFIYQNYLELPVRF